MNEITEPIACLAAINVKPMDRLTAQKVLGRQIKSQNKSNEGYLVEFENGYQTWAPKEAFESGIVPAANNVVSMKQELKELRERIAAGTLAYLDPEVEMSAYQRVHLGMQLKKMNEYAEILCRRTCDALDEFRRDEYENLLKTDREDV